MIKSLPFLIALAAFSFTTVHAQEAPEAEPELTEEEMEELMAKEEEMWMQHIETFGWSRGGVGDLGKHAEIQIPEGFRFAEKDGSQKLMEEYGNQLSGSEQGLIAPEDLDWFAIFEFNATGKIPDDDKDDIDADAILKDYRKGAKAQGESRGMSIEVVGWASPPAYNEMTNNLEWGIEYLFDGYPTVNYQTHLLGRRGDMEVTLVCGPEQLDEVLVEYQKLISGFNYKDGERYDQWEDGDKLAEYGLTGLVAAGGLFAAAKLGLFAKLGKLWKPIVIGVIALGAGIKKFFGRMFGNHQ